MLPRPLFLPLVLLLGIGARAQEPRVHTSGSSGDLNRLVLNAVGRMPTGGRYSTSAAANQRLAAAVRLDSTGLALTPSTAQPSYCSGATYQVFLDAIQHSSVQLGPESLRALLIHGQRDGEGVWGRWNANGPGTARLFAEAGLGRNFTDWSKAKPGDFLKVWWNNEIGQREHGHSVVFLGVEGEDVLIWSSNIPDGYGRRSVPRSKIKWAVFSRFEHPEALARLPQLPRLDPYLASLLTHPSTRAEVAERCAIRD